MKKKKNNVKMLDVMFAFISHTPAKTNRYKKQQTFKRVAK